jgi:hypothetical protein
MLPLLVKEADSRSAGYEEEHGDGCWELDALDPEIIAGLVSSRRLSLTLTNKLGSSTSKYRSTNSQASARRATTDANSSLLLLSLFADWAARDIPENAAFRTAANPPKASLKRSRRFIR